ncbi:hypothetical protein [Methanoregula formicica]|uniref:Uncharacterized protein n=1 Tax=Methanoregula formicica (strain DSM 22288 / NBRC 105244 / SMSP) TaxID=593750 RepID=L0HDC5_METFS|nr:hypothetical protein [Methanoregula formicica]AGB02025.1 hypothetical protein Metfor_0973 [Methanoregula formicica SMSP]
MRLRILTLILMAGLLALVCVPAQGATGGPVTVLYQNSFSSNPKWVTNNPSLDYWDPGLQMYHFAIEPSTGAYAYTLVKGYEKQPFTLEYDVILNKVDEGTTFRLGFSGEAMNPEVGPNVLTEFTNAKYGQIMWLRLVTPGNKLMKVNSESGDTQNSGSIAYKGPTVNYELNKTYRVTVDYNKDQRTLTMKVNEKTSGQEIWGYYINTVEDLSGMDRIYLGSIGDYGMMHRYAEGYLDNVRLTVPAEAEVTTPAAAVTTAPQTPTTRPTAIKTTVQQTALPTTAPQESPVPVPVTILALGIAGACMALFLNKRK